MQHDVDAGTLRKVVLSDGATVTVTGARSVSLRHPLEFPLPLNRSNPRDGHPAAASGLLDIAAALRSSARSSVRPLVSFRIVGPSSLTSSTSTSPNSKLKLKRLSPGLVQLSSRSVPASSSGDVNSPETRNLWPLTSLNGSHPNLRGFEELLASVLGKREKGEFRLLKAEVSAQTCMKMSFSVEKKLADGDVDWSRFPSWKTRPEKVTAHFEVLARVEGGRRVVAERIREVQPVRVEDGVMDSVQNGNVSMTQLPLLFPPQSFFSL